MDRYWDIVLVLLVVGWYAALWWLARREQVHPKWDEAVRVRPASRWVLWLCGAGGKSDSLHVPMAAAQLTAIAACLVSIILVITLPPGGRRQNTLPYLAATPFLTQTVAWGVMRAARVLRRR